ncbi:MAG: D-lyxose/D-mannose family sugar isomerase [Victivallales bacterium]|nr:D-lyxose/D-mannose family sugar isomerase [Victivallales bacterium]
MDELNKALKISVTGDLKKRALEKFERQMKEWCVKMPSADYLALDFGLGDFYRTGLIECWIANEEKEGYCGKFLFVFDGQRCPMHRHKDKHETFFIMRGSVSMDHDGKSFEMKPGETLPVGKWKYHSFAGVGPALLLEISKPCIIEDNYFENKSIPLGGNYTS